MLKRALIVFLLLGGAAFGQSSTPPKQPAEQHQSPAEQQPATKANQEKPPKSLWNSLSVIWDKTWEDPVAFYTFVLTGFTGLLAFVSFFQGVLLLRSDRTARIAANAADLSARAAIAIELPILRAAPNGLSHGSTREFGITREHCSAHYVNISNGGKTKALPIELQYGYSVGALPKAPRYPFTETYDPNAVIETDPKVTQTFLRENCHLEMGEWSLISSGNLTLWIYWNLVYMDFMRNRREAAFCWRWYGAPGQGFFRPDPTPEYNRKT